MGVIIRPLRESAKGQPCAIRFHGICNHDPETTVLAHLPSPMKGMGNKGDDWHAVFACSACHDALDNKRLIGVDVALYCLEALQRTQRHWFENGYLEGVARDRVVRTKPSSKILPRKPMTVQP